MRLLLFLLLTGCGGSVKLAEAVEAEQVGPGPGTNLPVSGTYQIGLCVDAVNEYVSFPLESGTRISMDVEICDGLPAGEFCQFGGSVCCRDTSYTLEMTEWPAELVENVEILYVRCVPPDDYVRMTYLVADESAI